MVRRLQKSVIASAPVDKQGMRQPMSEIAFQPDELNWVRMFIGCLRHPDPTIAQLACEALLYIRGVSQKQRGAPPLSH